MVLDSKPWTSNCARHMRPEHIAQYVDKADVYAYGEAGDLRISTVEVRVWG